VQAFVNNVFEQKSGMFAKKRVDEMKLLVIAGIELAPSIPGAQILAAVMQDTKRHSKDVIESARAAIINVKARLAG
jgi:hypothetical protein